MPESYKEDGKPADQWYWDDWFSAFDVRLCSLAARGLWIDMLGIMFKAEIRGTLTINGKQVDSKTLAKVVGETMANTKKFLYELEEQDVFSRLEDDTIICRRMFRKSGKQDQISKIRSVAGKKGADARWQKEAKIATSSSASSSIPKSIHSEKHSELAKLLEKNIKERMPKYKFTGNNYIETWANDIRLMEERDKRSLGEIEIIINWVSKDDFWYKNILSGSKLRKQFHRLWADMQDEAKKKGIKIETSEDFSKRQNRSLEKKI